MHASTSNTKRVTLTATVDASGRMLPPMLIFKGVTNGSISHEFSTYPDRGHYACQNKAWIDEDMMNRWIDQFLIPSQSEKAPDIITLLILDVY